MKIGGGHAQGGGDRNGRELRRERVTERGTQRKRDTRMEDRHQQGRGSRWDGPVGKGTYCASQAVRVQPLGPTQVEEKQLQGPLIPSTMGCEPPTTCVPLINKGVQRGQRGSGEAGHAVTGTYENTRMKPMTLYTSSNCLKDRQKECGNNSTYKI